MSAMKRNIGGLLAMAMMFEGMSASYATGSNGDRYYHPPKEDLDKGKGILIHNKVHEHEFVIHGKKITAPNKKSAIKIYNRKFITKKN